MKAFPSTSTWTTRNRIHIREKLILVSAVWKPNSVKNNTLRTPKQKAASPSEPTAWLHVCLLYCIEHKKPISTITSHYRSKHKLLAKAEPNTAHFSCCSQDHSQACSNTKTSITWGNTVNACLPSKAITLLFCR